MTKLEKAQRLSLIDLLQRVTIKPSAKPTPPSWQPVPRQVLEDDDAEPRDILAEITAVEYA